MSLGDRMKDYEGRSDFRLQRKMPVVMRLDGKAFHTLTRGLDRPWCERFTRCMWAAAEALCENVQGCQLAYVQSDEITLLLKDWQSHGTDAWFDYRVQKMCSVAASIATDAFTAEWRRLFDEPPKKAWFDARAWNIAEAEVTNAFIWRQRDATKNSVTMLAQAHFSHKELHGKNGSQKQDMLMGLDEPVNWNDCEVWQKRGVCIVKEEYFKALEPGAFGDHSLPSQVRRTRWAVDFETPIFSRDRGYIEKHLEHPDD